MTLGQLRLDLNSHHQEAQPLDESLQGHAEQGLAWEGELAQTDTSHPETGTQCCSFSKATMVIRTLTLMTELSRDSSVETQGKLLSSRL